VTGVYRVSTARGHIESLRQAAAGGEDPLVMIDLAAALWADGDGPEAARWFRRAYLARPLADSAWRLGLTLRPDVDPVAVRALARALASGGAAFTPVLAALAVSEARLGHADEVRRLVDYDRFFRTSGLPAPPSFGGQDFFEQLADEIKADLTFYGERTDRAIQKGWRSEQVLQRDAPALRALIPELTRAVEHYLDTHPGGADHWFLTNRPSGVRLEGWAVVSDAQTYHAPHIHARAWLSGVFYIRRPPVAGDGNGRRGWLHVGPPEPALANAGWLERDVPPDPGTLVLMPGYFFHRTEPMGMAGERICLAFDVVPEEFSPAPAA
jgi:hypothetical protein